MDGSRKHKPRASKHHLTHTTTTISSKNISPTTFETSKRTRKNAARPLASRLASWRVNDAQYHKCIAAQHDQSRVGVCVGPIQHPRRTRARALPSRFGRVLTCSAVQAGSEGCKTEARAAAKRSAWSGPGGITTTWACSPAPPPRDASGALKGPSQLGAPCQ